MSNTKSVTKPARLREGSKIGVFTPSEPIDPEMLDSGINALKSLGFQVHEAPHVRSRRGHLAGADEDRAKDFNALIADPTIDAVFCSAGGANSTRLLPLIDEKVLQQHPKIIMGVSDPSALLIGLHARSGIVTFHGPAVQYDFGRGVTELTLRAFREALLEGKAGPLTGTESVRVIRKGSARGRLIAGNLSTLVQLIGTPWEPKWDGVILCWEDVCEQPHSLDARLTHLRNAGILARLAGIIVGELVECNENDYPETPAVEDILLEHLAGTNYPVLWKLPFGHTPDKITIPLGVNAVVNTSGTLITLEESGVQ